jgi:hypothetical protein
MTIAVGFATSVVGAAGMGGAKGATLGTCDSDYAAWVAPAGATDVVVHPPSPPFLGCGMTFRMGDGSVQHLAAPIDWSLSFVVVLVIGVTLLVSGAATEARRQGWLRLRPALGAVGDATDGRTSAARPPDATGLVGGS